MGSFTSSEWLALAALWVNIVAIIVAAYVAYIIGTEIQKRITNDGKLKDYFSSELIHLKDEFQHIINDVYYTHPAPNELRSKITTLSQEATSIMECLHSKYRIEDTLTESLIDLSVCVMESAEYGNNARENTPITFSEATKQSLRTIEREKANIFNRLLLNLYGKE